MEQFTLQEIEDTFLMKILPNTERDGGCLNFLGGKTSQGYGSVYIKGIAIGTHRVAYAYYHNTIRFNNLFVLHSCDNPKCLAKEHLRLGTHQENMQDMVDRNRTTRKLTDEEIIEIYTSDRPTEYFVDKYSITKQTVNTIRNRTNWAEVTEGLVCGVPDGKERTRESFAILTKEQVKEIYLAEDTLRNLAKKFGTEITTISKIKCGINWQDVTAPLGKAGSSQHPFKAKLTKEDVAYIYTSKESSKDLAIAFNLSSRSVNQIRSKETWKTFTDTLDKKEIS